MSNTTTTGSQRYGNRRHGLGWVPWLALFLLALIAAVVYLLLQNVNDNNDASGVDLTDDEVAATANANTGGSGDGAVTSDSNAGSAAIDGAITTASGTDVLITVGSGQGAPLVGQPVTASGVNVNAVVANEGFWVGDATNQVFVHLTQAARGTGESGYQVAVGQKVDLAGTITKTPADIGDLGVTDSEGASQLENQGVYVDATSFSIK